MKVMAKTFLALTFAAIISGPAYGLSGLRLLAVEVGARPVGMGGAFASIAADPYSAAYNPAAGYRTGPLAASLGYCKYWQNINIPNLSLSFEKKSITYAIDVQYGAVSDIQGRTSPTSDYYPFDSHDFSLKAGASFKIDEDITFGFMAGWMFEKIEIYRGSGACFDLGLLATPFDKVGLGLSALNLGPKIKLRDEEFSLPTAYRAGVSYAIKNFLPAADLVVADDELRAHFGGEYVFSNIFFLRAGYRIGYDLHDISFGAGFTKRNLRIDYAFAPYQGAFDDVHHFSLTFQL
jgi:hypothetical protein